jgi:hypothetical protein
MEGGPSITSATARFMAEVTESGWLSAGLVSSPCMILRNARRGQAVGLSRNGPKAANNAKHRC